MKNPPFTNMAISLSGGGYRASAFHLGALSLLDAIKPKTEEIAKEDQLLKGKTLLENVKVISTISGGTLTGVMYALKLAEGKNFKDCYDKLYDLLEKDELVERALDKLNSPIGRWRNKHKNRNLINSFSEIYDEHFYEGATFEKILNDKHSHLQEVIFGASEFTHGFHFRFQKSGRFGNFKMSLPKKVSKDIRLADIAAASSCFPGGFEPLVMPNDFSNGPKTLVDNWWKKGVEDFKDTQSAEDKYTTTAFMDGGILDNQGIEGVMKAEDRNKEEDEDFIGTFIISDVSGKNMSPYQVPTLKQGRFANFITIQTLNLFAIALMIIAVIALIFTDRATGIVALSTALLTVTASWLVTFFFIRSRFKNQITDTFEGEELPDILNDLNIIVKTPIAVLLYLIKFRLSSSLKMITDLFLRRIRYLQRDRLFDDPSWRYRIVENNIYTLKTAKKLTPALKDVIARANRMPTTFWFTQKEKQENMLDSLIACGQFTLCSELANYLRKLDDKTHKEEVWNRLSEVQKVQIKAVLKIVEDYWKKFRENPHWLVEQYKKK